MPSEAPIEKDAQAASREAQRKLMRSRPNSAPLSPKKLQLLGDDQSQLPRVELAREDKTLNELITSTATQLAESTNSDILLFSGGIERPYDDRLLDLLASMKKRENVILFLCTRGGNADAAYRMARGLQQNYKRFTVVVAGRCKSAGTLLVIGAHEIAMTDHAELGPLDVQIGKKRRAVRTRFWINRARCPQRIGE